MLNDQEKEEILSILKYHGNETQIIKLGEECGELSVMVLQRLCPTKDKASNEEKMYEELADVYNVFHQAMMIFDSDRIKQIAAAKRMKHILKHGIPRYSQKG